MLLRLAYWPSRPAQRHSWAVSWALLMATLTLLDATNTQHKIRLAGIDSPEKGQPFGQVCKKSLSDLAYDRVAAVESTKLDWYGRVIGKVLVDGQDVNLEQVRRGCGWHYKKYQNEQRLDDRLSYNAAEESARSGRVGLWTDLEPGTSVGMEEGS